MNNLIKVLLIIIFLLFTSCEKKEDINNAEQKRLCGTETPRYVKSLIDFYMMEMSSVPGMPLKIESTASFDRVCWKVSNGNISSWSDGTGQKVISRGKEYNTVQSEVIYWQPEFNTDVNETILTVFFYTNNILVFEERAVICKDNQRRYFLKISMEN